VQTRDPEEIRRATDEILERSEFADPSGWQERLAELLDPIQLFNDAFDWLRSAITGSDGTLALAVAWAILALLAGIVTYLVFRLARDTSVGASVSEDSPAREQLRSASLLDKAKDFEANRQWGPAIRCYHGSLIADLADRGIVVRRPGTTAREYQRQIQVSAPKASDRAVVITDTFERIWYGSVAPSEQDVRSFEADCAQIKKLVRK
jgi:hypothetical protein